MEELRELAASAFTRGARDTTWALGDTAVVSIGRLFDSSRRHVYVHVSSFWWGDAASAVYDVEHGTVSDDPLLVQRTGPLTFVRDTLLDANGDGARDFAQVWYSSAGCCRRYNHSVHLYDSATGRFVPAFELMNPTYDPVESVVRGVEYGHPGEVPLYKARFSGLREPDIVECVYPIPETPGRFIRGRCDLRTQPTGDTLDALPREYEAVEDLDWFLLYTASHR